MNGYGYMYPDNLYIPGAIAGAGIGVLLGLLLLIPVTLAIVSYVFQACGLHAIAKRRGIRNGWLSWIPVGNLWVLGSISDQYRYVVKGQITNRRKLLLWLSVAMVLAAAMVAILVVASMISLSTQTGGMGMLAVVILLLFAEAVVSVIAAVFLYIALYDLFQSCNPGIAVLFLVLSILIPVTLPFFLFACRKKDEGMPPRKQRPETQNTVCEPVVLVEPVAQQSNPEEESVAEGFANPEEFEEEQ